MPGTQQAPTRDLSSERMNRPWGSEFYQGSRFVPQLSTCLDLELHVGSQGQGQSLAQPPAEKALPGGVCEGE